MYHLAQDRETRRFRGLANAMLAPHCEPENRISVADALPFIVAADEPEEEQSDAVEAMMFDAMVIDQKTSAKLEHLRG
jgi:hypothetical protein